MRRFVLQALAFAALQILLVGLLALRNPPDPETYYAATCLKHDRLSTRQGPRLILVGGSGLTFGTDSAQLEQRLKRATVNMSLHADLGLAFMLNEIEPSVRQGDVVLLSFEYEHFFSDQTSWDRALLPVLEQRPQSIAFLDADQLKELSDNGLGFLGNRARQWLRYLRGKHRRPAAPPYTLGSFNPYGDVVAHYQMQPTDNRDERWRITTQLDPSFLDAVTDRINRFVACCRMRNATVFFAYPAITSGVYRELSPQIEQLQRHFDQALDCTIMDTPEESAWPTAFFFNSKYHLNRAGVSRRTDHLQARLLVQLDALHQDPERTPPAPPLQPTRPADGM